ncbi:MAG: acyl-CoA dehydrogenase [Gammaproteobacteria bacterium]
MSCIFWLITLLAVIGTMAYLGVRIAVWSVAVTTWLLALSLFSDGSIILLSLLWVLLAMIVVPLNIPSLRRQLISDRVFTVFKKALPAMSQTEREALEAGTVWWDGELFSGSPNWEKLLAYPIPKLSEEEQAFIDGPVDELCRMLDDWQITEKHHDLPPEVWQFIKDNGFFGMIIPKEYGGLDYSALAHSTVVMKIASRSITAAVTVMVPNSLGPAELLLHYGTQEQKDYYLPRLAKGEEVPCFALTGPSAGSDASSIPDHGVVCHGEFEGKEVLGIRLNWEKRYITLGPVATVLGLAFKLYDPDKLLGQKEELGITVALIPTGTPGITIGNRHAPLSQAFQNGPNSGKDVFIPMDWLIGGAEWAGQGWRMLMESLAAGRSISLPALSTGGGKLACRATGAYARIRKQFKMAIGQFEGVEEALARIAANAYVMDAARTMTAGAVDLGEKPSVPSAIVKYNLTERMRQSINDAMDIQGGTGICMGPRNLVGRIYQAIPISITVEGANILTRTLITYGQGAIRCHPFVLKEMMAVNEKNAEKSLQEFDAAFFGHIGFSVSNAVRSLWLGISGARFVNVPGGDRTKRYYQQLTRMSAAFALTSDVAMLVLGGALKRKEKLSGRLADVLSQLYLASCVLKRFEDQGRPSQDQPLVQWALEDSLYQIQQRFDEILDNFPQRPIAWILRVMIFPLGKHFSAPSDRLGNKVATVLLQPSEVRDRLTDGVFVTTSKDEPMGRIEVALKEVVMAEAVEKKLRKAIREGRLQKADDEQLIVNALDAGIIDETEAQQLRYAAVARRDVIMVDDFPQDYWRQE